MEHHPIMQGSSSFLVLLTFEGLVVSPLRKYIFLHVLVESLAHLIEVPLILDGDLLNWRWLVLDEAALLTRAANQRTLKASQSGRIIQWRLRH